MQHKVRNNTVVLRDLSVLGITAQKVPECGKIQTKITPNRDTFHAVDIIIISEINIPISITYWFSI